MKPASDAFARAIQQAEKSLKRRAKGVQETPQERGHTVTKLSAERARKRRDEARQIVQQVRRLGLDADTLAKIDAAAKAHAEKAEEWGFTMISTAQQAAVLDWLTANSKRPLKAVKLWGHLLANLDRETGEIVATRQDLAERVGMEPRDLSSTMTELASINAVRREKRAECAVLPQPKHRHASAKCRAACQGREEAGPLLKIMEGGLAGSPKF